MLVAWGLRIKNEIVNMNMELTMLMLMTFVWMKNKVECGMIYHWLLSVDVKGSCLN